MGSITLHLLLSTLLLLLLDLVKKLEVRQCAVPGGFLLSPSWLLLTQTCLCQVISEEGAEKTSPDDGTLWRFMGEARLVSSMPFPSSEVISITSPANASSSLASLEK